MMLQFKFFLMNPNLCYQQTGYDRLAVSSKHFKLASEARPSRMLTQSSDFMLFQNNNILLSISGERDVFSLAWLFSEWFTVLFKCFMNVFQIGVKIVFKGSPDVCDATWGGNLIRL